MTLLETAVSADVRSQKPAARSGVWAWLRRSRWVTAGLILLGIFVVIAIFGSTIAPDDPSAIGLQSLAPPSAHHLLGTTQTGQDVLSQLLIGAQSTLLIGFMTGLIATALSVIVGVSAGYFGGNGGELLSLLSNIFLVIPGLPLLIVLASYVPHASWWVFALVLSLVGWAWGARVLRAQTLAFRQQDFVQAAKAAGESNWRIIMYEILPNEVAIVATSFVFTVVYAIGFYVALCFLGLGNINTWSWGTMLYYAQSNQAITSGAWWWYVPPGIAVALLILGLVMLNFGIDEFINPRLRAAGLTRRDLRMASKQQGITPVLGTRPVPSLAFTQYTATTTNGRRPR
ncbi:MAG TPA: ABC transporter permease [Streptosporangiaceae bacterium]